VKVDGRIARIIQVVVAATAPSLNFRLETFQTGPAFDEGAVNREMFIEEQLLAARHTEHCREELFRDFPAQQTVAVLSEGGGILDGIVHIQSHEPAKQQNVLPCPGAPPITTNRIDATRYFVRQHYLDFLGREPDLDGWNWWTSEITECAFDLNCIRTERQHIGHAFILVANSVVQDPDMANPPGTPGFNAATYNRAFVRHCYLNYLRREPDADGWNHWTNELNSDGNYWHILDAFQLAPEYRNRFCIIC
jgi:uncharacterized protein DUF4214